MGRFEEFRMKKKTKIILNLSIVGLILAGSAQFYTNYKIEQTLQQFPYHFSDNITLYVTQQEKDFFTRKLTFSIAKDNHQPQQILFSKLTSLPFAITATSQLTPKVVHQLNEQWNITIDENQIRSNFSVVGDYLSTTMDTQFRDATNTAQKLQAELDFVAKTSFIELKTKLTGFNYSSTEKLKRLRGNYSFQPLNDHHYELVNANFQLGLLDFKDGENNHYKLNGIDYQLNKNFTNNKYDANLLISAEKTTLNQTQIDNLTLNSQQKGLMHEMTMLGQLKKITPESTPKQLLISFLDYALANQQWQFNLQFDQLTNKENDTNFNLSKSNASINFSQNNEQKGKLEWQINTEGGTFSQKDKTQNSFKQLQLNYQAERMDFAENVAFLAKFLPDNIVGKKNADVTKDNRQFEQALAQFTQHYYPSVQFSGQLGEFNFEGLKGKDLQLHFNEQPEDDQQLTSLLTITGQQFASTKQYLSINKFNLNLPVIFKPAQEMQSIYLCTHSIYTIFCSNHLTAQSLTKHLQQNIAALNIQIEKANLTGELDTYPKASQTYKFTTNLDLISPSLPHIQENILAQKWQHTNLTLQFSIPEGILTNNENKADSDFWLWIKSMQNSPLFSLQDGAYQLKIEKKAGKTYLNGHDLALPTNPSESIESTPTQPQ